MAIDAEQAVEAQARYERDLVTQTVTPAEIAEKIRNRLYRTDASQLGRILPQYPAKLTEDDIRFYHEQGYIAIEGVLSPEEVEAAKQGLSDLAWKRTPWDNRIWIQEEPYYETGGDDERVDDPELRIRKLMRFIQLDTRLHDACFNPRLAGILDLLIGPGSRMTQDMALLKPPFRGGEKPWHQDNAYFDWTPLGGVIGTWTALDEATVENGCMQVVPGTHLLGPAPHYHDRDCQIPDERVPVDKAVVVPLKPGGVLFFSGLIFHGTPPNFTPDRRRALQFHFTAAECRKMTFREHAELFSEGGAYAGCRKYDPSSGMPKGERPSA